MWAKTLHNSVFAVLLGAAAMMTAASAAGAPDQDQQTAPNTTPESVTGCSGHQDQTLTKSFYQRCIALRGAAEDAPDGHPATRHTAFVPLEPILFEFDKATLTERAKRTLDDIALYLFQHQDVLRVLVYGHTDSVGSQDYNYTLSRKRTQAVIDYLAEHDIPRVLLHGAAKGERMHADEYWTPQGRTRNRRVELYAVRSHLHE